MRDQSRAEFPDNRLLNLNPDVLKRNMADAVAAGNLRPAAESKSERRCLSFLCRLSALSPNI